MTRHQLRLHGSKKKRAAVDPHRIDALLAGESNLKEALDVDADRIAGLRAQAHALYDAAKWDRCVEVVLALAALDDVEPFDAVIVARAYHELGDTRNAAIWGEIAERMLGELEEILRGRSDGTRRETAGGGSST